MLIDFKNNFFGGTRANRFRITGNFPTGGGFTDYHVRAATIPNTASKTITYDYFGRKFHYPGERDYGTWSFTAWDDIGSNNIWGQIQKWHNNINNHYTNVSNVNPANFKVDNWKIQHLDLNDSGTALKEFVLHGCWPAGIQQITLNMGNPNTLNSFNVIMVFDYVEITGVTKKY